MHIRVPCRTCETRSEACWSKCEKYLTAKRLRDEARKRDEASSEFVSYCKERKIKRERRFGK